MRIKMLALITFMVVIIWGAGIMTLPRVEIIQAIDEAAIELFQETVAEGI